MIMKKRNIYCLAAVGLLLIASSGIAQAAPYVYSLESYHYPGYEDWHWFTGDFWFDPVTDEYSNWNLTSHVGHDDDWTFGHGMDFTYSTASSHLAASQPIYGMGTHLGASNLALTGIYHESLRAFVWFEFVTPLDELGVGEEGSIDPMNYPYPSYEMREDVAGSWYYAGQSDPASKVTNMGEATPEIPEPATLLLLSASLAGMAILRFRSNKRG